MLKKDFDTQPSKPQAIAVNPAGIPAELARLRQWVCWDYSWIKGKGKWDKPPLSPVDKNLAATDDPTTWSTFEAAYIQKKFSLSGIGFVFTADDPFCGIDLDDCRNPQTAAIEPWAQAIVDRLSTYTEISPSGTGIKLFCRAALPSGGKRFAALGIEIYDQGRYFTVTGVRIGEVAICEDRQNVVEAMVAELVAYKEASRKPVHPTGQNGHANSQANGHSAKRPSSPDPIELTDAEVIEKAFRMKGGEKFRDLWRGGWGGHGSASEADLALCNLLAFFVGANSDRIDALYRQSQLFRPKWEREDYRNQTIAKALEGRTEFYQPNYRRSEAVLDHENDEENDEECELPSKTLLEYFPVETLPGVLRHFADEVSKSMNCPVDFPCLAILTLAGAAIGNSRALQVKRGWRESGRFWVAIVAPPGSSKSPAVDVCCEPLFQRQAIGSEKWRREKIEWDDAKEIYDHAVKAGRAPGIMPAKPGAMPFEPHWYTTDATVEVMNAILQKNPRGVCLVKDEITGWILSMNQYKGGKGADRQFYLSSWSGASSKTDRKSNLEKGSLTVPRPFVNILGGIQPDMLHELCDEKGRQDGFVHRLLFCHHDMPDAGDWSANYVTEASEEIWAAVLNRLHELEMEDDSTYGVRPKLTHFTPDGKAMWIRWYNDHQAELRNPDFPDQLKGPWSKLRAYCARVALVLHYLRLVAFQLTGECDENEEAMGEAVTASSVMRAAVVIQYFKHHLRSVYRQLETTREDDRADRLVQWLARRTDRKASVRDLQRAEFAKKASDAKELIKDVVDRGMATALTKTKNPSEIIGIALPKAQVSGVG